MACLVLRKTSDWWYGRYRIDGNEYVKNLQVNIRGTRPLQLSETGSKQFELSRAEAMAALNSLLNNIKSGRSAEELAQAVYQARTGGRRVETYMLADLPDIWLSIPRKRKPTENYTKQCISWITNFLEFCENHFPTIEKLDHFSPEQAKAFMDWQEERGISPKTWNQILAVFKAVFIRAGSPVFNEFRTKDTETAFRIPYSPDELQAIFEAANTDDFIRPIIITAACTALRRGDCCLLEWKNVDLKEGFITIKTSKTGATVDIPIFPLLFDELSARKGNGSKYVFPQQALKYKSNPKLLTARLRKVLAIAGFRDEEHPIPKKPLAEYNLAELNRKAEKHIATVPTKAKRERMSALLGNYLAGDPLCKSAEAHGIPKGTASGYLKEIEIATGIAFIRGHRPTTPLPAYAPKRGNIHEDRATGLHRASVRDFHSFRTTWITLALTSGIPFEIVKQVTGHTTAAVVMKHYFRPQRAQLKQAIQKSMPNLLTAGAVTPSERAAETLRKINSKNWRKCSAEALKILEGS